MISVNQGIGTSVPEKVDFEVLWFRMNFLNFALETQETKRFLLNIYLHFTSIRDHSFSTYAKLLEKLSLRIRG